MSEEGKKGEAMKDIERRNGELQLRNMELEQQLRAAEDKATRCEIEAQDMYETANSQLQKSLEFAQERIRQLERENGTLALALAVYRSRSGEEATSATIPEKDVHRPEDSRQPPFSPLKATIASNLQAVNAQDSKSDDLDDLEEAQKMLSLVDDEEEDLFHVKGRTPEPFSSPSSFH